MSNQTQIYETPENYTANYGRISAAVPLPKNTEAVERYREDAKSLRAYMEEKFGVNAIGEASLLFFLAELILDN